MTDEKTKVLVCEDGDEYTRRFERFLSERFEFVRTTELASLLTLLCPHHPFAALLLDRDFSRCQDSQLVDEDGQTRASLSQDLRRRLASDQGILILRQLRLHSITIPTVLFADFEDRLRASFLEQSLFPLTVMDSHAGLPQLMQHLDSLARQSAQSRKR